MILGGKMTVLFGENSFERTTQLKKICDNAVENGFEIERPSTDNLDFSELVSSVCGVSLLAEKRLVIFRSLSENSAVWEKFAEVAERISGDVHLVLIEEKIDKRGAFYKKFSKTADFIECKNLDKKNAGELAELARKVAKQNGLNLGLSEARELVAWVGLSEWAVKNGVERLVILGDASKGAIEKYLPRSVEANTFAIFEMSLAGDINGVMREISKMRLAQDDGEGFRFLSLVITQFFNMAALKSGVSAGVSAEEVARAIGANAWALKKMSGVASRFNNDQMAEICEKLAAADELSKTENVEIWDLVESALLEIASEVGR